MRTSPTPWEIDFIAMVRFFLCILLFGWGSGLLKSVPGAFWVVLWRGLPSREHSLFRSPFSVHEKSFGKRFDPATSSFTIWDGPIPHELHMVVKGDLGRGGVDSGSVADKRP
ncbi:hypothetical protein V8F33_003519 [Rhypophila sp. PSN 637]